MKVHVLQHVPFEGLGSIESWLAEQNAVLSWTRFFEEPRLPPIKDIDLVIALGGPMSVNDEIDLPWLAEEKRFVREAVDAGKSVLGICLGAQLIASALGARVYPARNQEIGWFDIEALPALPDAFTFPSTAKVFHWHGETFDLPPGAIRLARSEGCENQSFQLGAKVVGLQFHLETTPDSVEALIAKCRNELTGGAFVQTEARLRSASPADYARINALMTGVLDHIAPPR